MLDHDLAGLYGVTTGNLNKAVKRNIKVDRLFEHIDRLQERLEAPVLPERKQIGYEIGGKK
jgi:hypothetical protein